MAAMGEKLKAKTKAELRSRAAAFRREAKRRGFSMQAGYSADRVQKTKDGFEIYLRAHS